ncbi:MAG: sulfate adenylyltransferase subunit CysN [Thermoleophilaceae bacterium]|nr:sulfate adenylyltransferase subunit CysN [Thermoleophilaceae bacterium]
MSATSNGHGAANPEAGAPDLLRLATAGSVDDGKSTLIGRLLFDSKLVFEDQLEHVTETSKRRGDGYVNLALLTDGLRAEREQGITIDVAYRYFATPKRRFIIADTPGHEQYTRNMVTGASTADLSVVLIDARNGVTSQSRRHASISSLLGIHHLVVCVNKMDLVDWDESVFKSVKADFQNVAEKLEVPDITFIPISALNGDNVVDLSEAAPWYPGPALLDHLERVDVSRDRNLVDGRFPVQYVIRPMSDSHHDYRGYAGQVASGVFRPGEEVVVLPSGKRTHIAAIDTFDGEAKAAFPPMSVTLLLEDDVAVSRGDMIAHADAAPEATRALRATVCWMDDAPLRAGAKLAVKLATKSVRAVVEDVCCRLDVETLDHDDDADELGLNDMGTVELRLSSPLVADPYVTNRGTGSFILIDESTNHTVGAGMVA